MNWPQLLLLVVVLAAAVLLVWRSSGKKTGGCGCEGGCAHEPDPKAKKPEAGR